MTIIERIDYRMNDIVRPNSQLHHAPSLERGVFLHVLPPRREEGFPLLSWGQDWVVIRILLTQALDT